MQQHIFQRGSGMNNTGISIRLIAVIALFSAFFFIEKALSQNVNTGQAAAQTVQAADAAGRQSVADNGTNGGRQEVGTSLFHTVKRGGPMMIPIILCGIVALTLVIERLIYFTRKKIWHSEQLELFLRETSQQSKARFREEKADELREAFQKYLNQMERGLVFLQGLSGLAPLLGFLGTVTGMITAFAAIAAATTVNARIVAVGIQEALITTAGGLFIAAPSTFFYYLFLHVIHQRMGQSEEIIEALCADLPRMSDSIEEGEAIEEYR
jgi:biopolymer transport protein ExbB